MITTVLWLWVQIARFRDPGKPVKLTSLDFQPKTGRTEQRFVDTADEALSVYTQLYNKLTSLPHNMEKVRSPPCSGIGSDKFQQVPIHFCVFVCFFSMRFSGCCVSLSGENQEQLQAF